MVLHDLHRIWDDIPLYGKAIAAVAVLMQVGAVATWLGLMRKELQKHKKD
jgi:hypothetical protein